MASRKYEMPPTTIALPQADGRVEVTVHGDEIWVSDYAADNTSHFTFVIQRGPLKGSDNARAVVADSCKTDQDKGGWHRPRVAAARAAMASASSQMGGAGTAPPQPRRAGYWYEDPNWTGHGGPVVIVEQ
jgi:hypothetical protein